MQIAQAPRPQLNVLNIVILSVKIKNQNLFYEFLRFFPWYKHSRRVIIE